MNQKLLTPGTKVFFKNDKAPFELIARTNRYAVTVRKLDIDADYDLICFQVERGAYFHYDEALKDDPVYSIIDFEKQWRGPNNLIFNNYDYWSKEEIEQSLKDLENEEYEISKRHGIPLDIDWGKTLKQVV